MTNLNNFTNLIPIFKDLNYLLKNSNFNHISFITGFFLTIFYFSSFCFRNLHVFFSSKNPKYYSFKLLSLKILNFLENYLSKLFLVSLFITYFLFNFSNHFNEIRNILNYFLTIEFYGFITVIYIKLLIKNIFYIKTKKSLTKLFICICDKSFSVLIFYYLTVFLISDSLRPVFLIDKFPNNIILISQSILTYIFEIIVIAKLVLLLLTIDYKNLNMEKTLKKRSKNIKKDIYNIGLYLKKYIK